MANPIGVLPDATLAVIQYLRNTSVLCPALIAVDHILTQIPLAPSYPYILVQQAGGRGIWPALDDVSLQVDVIGDIQERCNLIARTVRAAIWAIANDVVSITSNGSTVSAILASGEEETAPAWMPDMEPTPPLSRYTARYRVILH